MELKVMESVANEILEWLKPYCSRIIVAGAIRRRKPNPNDIEILCIPKESDNLLPYNPDWLNTCILGLINNKKLNYRLNSKGSRVYGPKNKLLVHCPSGIPVDIFSTTEVNWWVSIVVRTGPKESNIKICMEAKKRGLKFHAYGDSFTKADGSKIVCHSEKEVFETAGLPYLPPERRR